MSYVTTYILAPHEDDIENVGKLNEQIWKLFDAEGRYQQADDEMRYGPFRELGCHLWRNDAGEFFGAHINHFTPNAMVNALNAVKWEYPERLSVQYSTERMEYWLPMMFIGGQFVHAPKLVHGPKSSS